MRRRLLLAILIIATNLFLLAWVDDRLLLRNPVELDTRARLILRQLFPDQEPTIEHIEVDFSGRRVIVQGLEFLEKGTGRDLLKVEHIEATLSLTDWLSPHDVSIRGLTARVRLKGEHLNIEDLVAGGGKSGSTRTSAINLDVENVNVDFEDENTGSHSLAVCEKAELKVEPDGRVTGTGHARAGALVRRTSPFANGGAEVPGLPDLVYRELIQKLDFEVDRRADGRTAIPVYVEHVMIGPLLRSLLPPYVQNVIWAELNPEGVVDANATLNLGVKSGFDEAGKPRSIPHVAITLHVRNGAIKVRGFPYPIHDIAGRFEVAVGPGPIISWEDVTARLDGNGRVTKARGSFFLGDDTEKVSLYVFVDATDVPLNDTLRKAMPPDIGAVYDQFQVQGVSGPAKVVIFKGPFMEDPQLSIRTTLDGRQSAAFADYPVRLKAEKGSFTLREGGNVEISADGTLEGGGDTHVEARVIHGDLLHVHVQGKHVLVTQPLLAKLDEPVRRMVDPFKPRGGEVDFDVTVEKSDPDGSPRPRASVTLNGVTVSPDIFPYRLRTDGVVNVTPRFRPGAPANERPEITVEVATTVNANAITAGVVSGTVVLDPRQKEGTFNGQLHASCARIEVDPEVRQALPPELRVIADRLSPEGALRNIKAEVRSLESFEAEGEGDGMTTALDSFPYRVGIDRFSLDREDRVVTLRHVEGTTRGNGHYSLQGTVELSPEHEPSADPFVQVGIEAHGVALDGELLAALPGEARRSLERLSPAGGKIDAALKVAIAPALAFDLTGTVGLSGTKFFLDKLDPSLEGLAQIPVEDVEGKLRLDGERVWIDGLRGRFRGVPVSAGGSIAMASGQSHSDGSTAATSSATTLDLVAHVDALPIDESTRKLARGAVSQVLGRFPVEGPCDLDFRVMRRGEGDPGVDVRVRPRGVRVVPKILPFPFEDVRGSIDVRGGDPVLVDLTAKLGKAEVEIHRDARLEEFVEPGTSVYRVKARGVHPEELTEAPEDFARTVKDFEIKGSIDLNCTVAIPQDERAKQRFLAELKTSDLALTSGLRFENCRAALRVAGTVAKFEPLELEGTLSLEHAEWKHQELEDARIPVRLREGLLTIGNPHEPFVGTLYGGQLRGRIETNLTDHVIGDLRGHGYQGAIFLQGGQMRVAADQLAKLAETPEKAEPKSGGASAPVKGELTARLDFQGGGVSDFDKKPIGLSGDATILAKDANFIPVPLLFGMFVDVVKGVARGDSSYDPKSFDRLYTKLKLRPAKIDIDLFRLDSDTLTVAGRDGRVEWDGTDLELDLLPFKTGGIFDEIFKQFVGVSVRGSIQHPATHEVPLYNGLERLWRSILGTFSSQQSPERVGETTSPAKEGKPR
jgi:hypothetical protein